MNELNLMCFVTNIVICVLCGALLPVIPTLTRKSFLFGVRVPAAESDCSDARALKRRYIAVCLIGAVVILAGAAAQYALAPQWSILAVMYFPLLFVVVQGVAFVPQHRAALRLKQERGWQTSDSVFADTKSSYTRGNLSAMPKIWFVMSLLVIFASAAVLLARYPSMPDIIPTHYGINMEPDAWAEKSLPTLLTLQLVNLATVALMFGVGAMIEKTKLQIDTDNPELSFAQHSAYRRRMAHSLGFMTLCMAVMLAVIDLPQMYDGFRVNFLLWNLLWLVPTVVVCVVAVGSGQGGCKIKIVNVTTSRKTDGTALRDSVNSSDDRFWALGMFYHNPADPAILVGDRFGTNLGFNYSHRAVRIGVMLLALIIVALYVFFTVWWLSGPPTL